MDERVKEAIKSTYANTPLPSRVWCLVWQYSDKSGFGVMRVYSKKTRADADLQLLSNADSGRQWEVIEQPLIHE